MLYLVCDVILSAFAITKTTTVLLTILLEVTGRLYVWVILIFLTAEALIDEMNEDALTQVAELDHAFQESVDATLCLRQAQG